MEKKKREKKKIDFNTYDGENKDWLMLCEWIEINIFGYHVPDQRLQRDACLLLKGLQKGQVVANNSLPENGLYPLNVILMTFKLNKQYILNAIRNKNFDSERQKMSYICTIVRDRINDVYTKYLNAQKTKEKIDSIDTSAIQHQGADYSDYVKYKQSKEPPRKTNKRLEELW